MGLGAEKATRKFSLWKQTQANLHRSSPKLYFHLRQTREFWRQPSKSDETNKNIFIKGSNSQQESEELLGREGVKIGNSETRDPHLELLPLRGTYKAELYFWHFMRITERKGSLKSRGSREGAVLRVGFLRATSWKWAQTTSQSALTCSLATSLRFSIQLTWYWILCPNTSGHLVKAK